MKLVDGLLQCCIFLAYSLFPFFPAALTIAFTFVQPMHQLTFCYLIVLVLSTNLFIKDKREQFRTHGLILFFFKRDFRVQARQCAIYECLMCARFDK